MAAIPKSRMARPSLASKSADLVFPFLAPSIQCPRSAPCNNVARFSTSPALLKRDNNKNRGLSILRHTGPRKRQTLSVKKYLNDLPKPVKPEKPLEGDPDHGLWGFFKDKQLLRKPTELARHGRAWTVPELRKRSWPDLHGLWWICVKERNRLATEKIERARLEAGYGDEESRIRDETIQETMKAIMDTLLERHKAWEEAHNLASQDPSIDLNKTDGPQLVVETYDTEELFEQDTTSEEDKGLPEKDYFKEQEPQTLKEKIKSRANKILWNR